GHSRSRPHPRGLARAAPVGRGTGALARRSPPPITTPARRAVMTSQLTSIDGPLTAFVAGLVTSLHCAVMCGPIALLLAPRHGDGSSFLGVTAVYHGTRLLAITLGGALAGGL